MIYYLMIYDLSILQFCFLHTNDHKLVLINYHKLFMINSCFQFMNIRVKNSFYFTRTLRPFTIYKPF